MHVAVSNGSPNVVALQVTQPFGGVEHAGYRSYPQNHLLGEETWPPLRIPL